MSKISVDEVIKIIAGIKCADEPQHEEWNCACDQISKAIKSSDQISNIDSPHAKPHNMTPEQLQAEMLEWLGILTEYANGSKKWDTGGVWVCERHNLYPFDMGYSFDCDCGPGMPPFTSEKA